MKPSHNLILLIDYLRRGALARPEATALLAEGREMTYAELWRAARALAGEMARRGVRRGDRVLLFLPNSLEYAAAFWAIQYLGAAAVPVSPDTKAAKLAWMLDDCEPRAALADAALRATLEEAGAACRHRFERLWQGEGDSLLGPWPEAADVPPGGGALDQDLAAIIYTSGSTGFPKGVMLSQRNMVAASQSVSQYLGLEASDRILCAIPLTFDYGLHQLTMSALVGASVIIEASFAQPLFTLARLVRFKATVFPIVPTMLALLAPIAGRFDFSSVRKVTNTAAALHPEAIDQARAIFRNAELFSMYGLTECHRCTYLPPAQLDARKGSVGVAIPNTELWLVDEAGRRHTRAAEGELVIRGATVMRGYWNNPAKTAEKLRPGPLPGEMVLYTGDWCRLDDEGYLYFLARLDEVLKVKGEKVAPKEIEAVLQQHPDIELAAVIGIDHPVDGQRPLAFVQPRAGALSGEADWRAWCQARLQPFMLPSRILAQTALPKNGNGKIDKLALRAGLETEPASPALA
nr:class I adenylate-forming enzyme family protein [Chromobacterium sp. ASV5]